MTVYDSFTSWIHNLLAWMGSCLGGPTRALMDDPHKGLQSSFSEDFWGSSTGNIDIPIDLLRKSFTSLSTSNLGLLPDLASVSTNPQAEFVNHGLLFWTKNRLQWIGAIKSSSHSHQAPGPSISLNATYDTLLSQKGRFRRPIPLGEMVDFLGDVWEQEGLYD